MFGNVQLHQKVLAATRGSFPMLNPKWELFEMFGNDQLHHKVLAATRGSFPVLNSKKTKHTI